MEGEGGLAGSSCRKVACGTDPTAQRHSPRGPCVWEKASAPPHPSRDTRAGGPGGPGDDAPSCGVDFVGGPRGGGIWHLRSLLLAVWFSAS